jgi:hypothetical protein
MISQTVCINNILYTTIIMSFTLQHTACEMDEIRHTFFIECENCIDKIRDQRAGGIYDCKCCDKTRIIKVCLKCDQIKDAIQKLRDELDELLYNLHYNIKQYMDCADQISQIGFISNSLRHYNRLLLEADSA